MWPGPHPEYEASSTNWLWADVVVSRRRRIVLGAAACAVAGPGLTACSPVAREQEAAHALRRPGAGNAGDDRNALMRELVRHATLAPSSHNTQCWTFQLRDRSIVIAPDLSRRCPVVDPDDHHLHVSLGCAAENLAQAALAHALGADVRFEPEGAGRIVVDLAPTRAQASALFQAIPERQCTRGDYDATPLSPTSFAGSNRQGPDLACTSCC